MFSCMAATVCYAECCHLNVLLTEAVHMNMWGLQLHFSAGDLSVQGCLSFHYRHKSPGDRAVSFFFFSASKANYIVTTSQAAVFNFAFCGVCVVTLVRQWERNSNTDAKGVKQNTSAFVLEAGRQGVHNAFEEKISGEQILKKNTPWFNYFNLCREKTDSENGSSCNTEPV